MPEAAAMAFNALPRSTGRTLRPRRHLRTTQNPTYLQCCHRHTFPPVREQSELFQTLQDIIPEKRELLREVKSKAGKKIGDVKVENVLGGMRGLKSMVWQGSVLDANEGIRFHGHTIADCNRLLPKGRTGKEMLPEAMFWLLLTGKIPSEAQIREFSAMLARQAVAPIYIRSLIRRLPVPMHPMTKMAIAVSALSHESTFAKKYAAGELKKSDYWETTFDDAISLIAKLPNIAGMIYEANCLKGTDQEKNRRRKKLENYSHRIKRNQDWAYNLASLLGFGGEGEQQEGVQDLLRLYIALHADHEGGNVSAHATHLVGSALSDPFLSYSAGLQGLAGPLHGLAAQDVLRFIQKLEGEVSSPPTAESVSNYLRNHLASGQVIPGYGHAVLRQPDPRFTALMSFASTRPILLASPLFKLVKLVSETAPQVLTEHGKTKNPHPNVDSASGVLFHGYGLDDPLFYTVIFGVSRALGPLAQLIWDRALGLPIERPKSISLTGLGKLADEGPTES